MPLVVSCLVQGESQARRMLDRLAAAGVSAQDITVLHAGARNDQADGSRLPPGKPTEAATLTAAPPSAAGGAAAGMFGWLVGYGVLAIPAAAIGAALGAAAGGLAAAELPESIVTRYGTDLIDDQAVIIVKADDAKGYDRVMRVYREEGGAGILVSGKGRVESAAERDDR
jgi:hypothetical protein